MINDLYETDFELINVRDLKADDMWFFNGRMVLVALILIITLLLMIAATAYDVLIYQKYVRVKKNRETCESAALKGNFNQRFDHIFFLCRSY